MDIIKFVENKTTLREVPCNGCNLCCKNDAIRLMPYDDKTLYKTEPHFFMRGEVMLAHKKNGDCYYLGANGCTIHDTKPAQCKTFDCRTLASITYTNSRKNKRLVPQRPWKKGKEMIKLYPL